MPDARQLFPKPSDSAISSEIPRPAHSFLAALLSKICIHIEIISYHRRNLPLLDLVLTLEATQAQSNLTTPPGYGVFAGGRLVRNAKEIVSRCTFALFLGPHCYVPS